MSDAERGSTGATGVTSVVAWNGSASSRAALLWGLERERSGLGGLMLLTVIDEAFRSCGQPAMDELTVAARQALEAEAAWIGQIAPEVAVTVTLFEGDPERELLRHAPEGSMLVVGRQEAHSHLHRRSLASRLASRASVPVALIRTDPGQDRTGVVAGVDGSTASTGAALVAAEEATRRREPLHLVHAWPGPGPGLAAMADAEGDLANHRRLLDEAERSIREGFPSLTIESHLEPGPAASALSRHALTAALLVVGSRAHGPVKRVLLGSVSRTLAETTDCPLVIVTEGDREPQLSPDRP